MKRYALLFGVLFMAICWSCTKDNEEPPRPKPEYVNPWIDPTDTVMIDGVAYFKGRGEGSEADFGNRDVMMTKITAVENATPWGPAVFSMTSNKENSFGLKFSGESCDPRKEPAKYVRLLVDSVKARPYGRPLPYDPALAEMPTFPLWYELGLDGIEELAIITENDFSAEYPAGSSLNGMCSLSVRSLKPVIELFKNWKPEYPMVEDKDGSLSMQIGDFLNPYIRACDYKVPLSEIDYSRTQWITAKNCVIWVNGFPSEAGEYPVQVIIRLHSGGKLTYHHTLVYGNF